MRRVAMAAATALIGTGSAWAADAPVTDPDWLRKPSPSEMANVWPTQADRSGSARITCTVTVAGALRACRVVEETPAGMGYGAAAILLAPSFQMRPAMQGGKPVEAEVTIPINFQCPEGCVFSMYGLRRVRQASNWATAPTFDEVVAAYPKMAKAEKVAGGAAISCRVVGKGSLSRCQILAGEPSRFGFQWAAKSLSDKFTGPDGIKPGTDVNPVAARIRFTFDPAWLEGVREVGQVDWVEQPSAQDFVAAFPATARAHGVTRGKASLRCRAIAQGRLDGCLVQSEAPANEGFGAAALGLSAKTRAVTWTEDGRPVIGGFVTVPMEFGSPAVP